MCDNYHSCQVHTRMGRPKTSFVGEYEVVKSTILIWHRSHYIKNIGEHRGPEEVGRGRTEAPQLQDLLSYDLFIFWPEMAYSNLIYWRKTSSNSCVDPIPSIRSRIRWDSKSTHKNYRSVSVQLHLRSTGVFYHGIRFCNHRPDFRIHNFGIRHNDKVIK